MYFIPLNIRTQKHFLRRYSRHFFIAKAQEIASKYGGFDDITFKGVKSHPVYGPKHVLFSGYYTDQPFIPPEHRPHPRLQASS